MRHYRTRLTSFGLIFPACFHSFSSILNLKEQRSDGRGLLKSHLFEVSPSSNIRASEEITGLNTLFIWSGAETMDPGKYNDFNSVICTHSTPQYSPLPNKITMMWKLNRNSERTRPKLSDNILRKQDTVGCSSAQNPNLISHFDFDITCSVSDLLGELVPEPLLLHP